MLEKKLKEKGKVFVEIFINTLEIFSGSIIKIEADKNDSEVV